MVAPTDARPGDTRSTVGTVLVLGAGGFIGGFIAAALHDAGWRVIRGVRAHRHRPAPDERECDVATMRTPLAWRPALEGVDAVVNVAGILRESSRQRFVAIHEEGPLALAQACVAAGVRRFVQISALGQPDDGEFIASKHRFDERLLQLSPGAVVLRPSVVYSASGSYGGTSLLRAMAALPGLLPLPGDGRWRIQPLAAEDLAALVVRVVNSQQAGIFEIGGPRAMSLRDYQQYWREWLRLPRGRVVAVPEVVVAAGVWLSDRLGRGPMGAATWRMLRRGNVAASDAVLRVRAAFDWSPRALSEALASRPSQTQDRWHAQLYFCAPLLRFGVVALFLLSAWSGFATPAVEIERVAAGSALAAIGPVALARAAAGVDLVLAAALVAGILSRVALAAMIALVLVYTLAFGAMLPALWLDPLGGLAKNLVVLPALAVLWVLCDRR
jgi:uncharacterized protein YbjT (DUF2867 family)